VKIREFLTFFKIRKNSLSERGRGSAVQFLFGLLALGCACLRNVTATTAFVSMT